MDDWLQLFLELKEETARGENEQNSVIAAGSSAVFPGDTCEFKVVHLDLFWREAPLLLSHSNSSEATLC